MVAINHCIYHTTYLLIGYSQNSIELLPYFKERCSLFYYPFISEYCDYRSVMSATAISAIVAIMLNLDAYLFHQTFNLPCFNSSNFGVTVTSIGVTSASSSAVTFFSASKSSYPFSVAAIRTLFS